MKEVRRTRLKTLNRRCAGFEAILREERGIRIAITKMTRNQREQRGEEREIERGGTDPGEHARLSQTLEGGLSVRRGAFSKLTTSREIPLSSSRDACQVLLNVLTLSLSGMSRLRWVERRERQVARD